MNPRKPKSIDMVHMLQSYPAQNPVLLKNHDYQVGVHLQIGYFVFMSGRLVFLPMELKGYDYVILQKSINNEL